ncbi:MAG: fibronectin/fibrinogen-binding protein [Clostridiales bacterium]|nr:fibronectin/fibrinogen-binding protein [Clostridiales bacterium]
MPQDAFTLKYVAEELNQILSGGKVNKITEPKSDEIIISIYKGTVYKLLISANASTARTVITNGESENPIVPFNFCMLLRKHLTGATLEKIEQLEFERIIKFTFINKNDFFEEEEKVLIAEIMGKYSNIMLLFNGKILGSIKTASLEEMSVRPILTGLEYKMPPKQEKISPCEKERIFEFINKFSGGDLVSYIFNGIMGISKETATEIVVRFFNKKDIQNIPDTEEFSQFLIDFLLNTKVNPCIIKALEKNLDFFVLDYKSISGERVFFDNIYKAQDLYYLEKENKKQITEKKNKLLSGINAYRKKLKKRLQIIEDKERNSSDMEINRIKGELLLSNSYKIKGTEEFVVLDNYYDGSQIKIALDKSLSVSKNSQNYFKKYNKQKRTLASILPQKEEILLELNYLDSVEDELNLALNKEDLTHVESELLISGIIRGQNQPKNKKKKEINYRLYEVNGVKIKVGKNNVSNEELTSSAKPKDLWIHTKNYPSAHVIIENEGRPVSEEIIKIGAEICAYYSKGRYGDKIEVDFTLKKHVKKPPKSKLGFFIYQTNETLVVNPSNHEEFIKSN